MRTRRNCRISSELFGDVSASPSLLCAADWVEEGDTDLSVLVESIKHDILVPKCLKCDFDSIARNLIDL